MDFRQKEKTSECLNFPRIFLWSERQDLNLRPPDPQSVLSCLFFNSYMGHGNLCGKIKRYKYINRQILYYPYPIDEGETASNSKTVNAPENGTCIKGFV